MLKHLDSSTYNWFIFTVMKLTDTRVETAKMASKTALFVVINASVKVTISRFSNTSLSTTGYMQKSVSRDTKQD
jgi:hypothetical protein